MHRKLVSEQKKILEEQPLETQFKNQHLWMGFYYSVNPKRHSLSRSLWGYLPTNRKSTTMAKPKPCKPW